MAHMAQASHAFCCLSIAEYIWNDACAHHPTSRIFTRPETWRLSFQTAILSFYTSQIVLPPLPFAGTPIS